MSICTVRLKGRAVRVSQPCRMRRVELTERGPACGAEYFSASSLGKQLWHRSRLTVLCSHVRAIEQSEY